MPTFSPNKGYPEPTVAGDTNQWGTLLDQMIGIVDLNLGGTVTIPLISNPLIASAGQVQNLVLRLTGTLTTNSVLQLPPAGGIWVVDNQTSGAFSVTVVTSAAGSTGTIVPQLAALLLYSDGTNVFPANGTRAGGATGSGLALSGPLTGTSANFTGPVNGGAATFTSVAGKGVVPIGAGMDWWTNTPPSGWIFAFGQAISRTTFAALFALWGTAYGAGDGTTTFNVIDARGRVSVYADNMGGVAANRVTAGGSGIDARFISATGGNQLLQQHGHTLTDPPHTHTVNDPGHLHPLSDPGHAHLITDPGHGHIASDPGHVHGLFDAGHAHSINQVSSGGSGIASGSGFTFAAGSTGSIATGVTVNPAFTGIGINTAASLISINSNTTGMNVVSAKAGTSNIANSTGISIAQAGSGGSQNMPPAIVCNYIIYAGV